VTKARGSAPRRLFLDRAARIVVGAGGLAIIASVLGILVFILHEVGPLASRARVRTETTRETPSPAVALLTDEHREIVVTLDGDGRVVARRFGSGREEAAVQLPLGPSGRIAGPAIVSGGTFAVGTDDGRVVLQRVETSASFTDGARRIDVSLPPPEILSVDPASRPIVRLAARIEPSGEGVTVAALTSDGTLVVLRETSSTNAMTGEVTRDDSRSSIAAPEGTEILLLDAEADNLYAGTKGGSVRWWRLDAAGLRDPLSSAGGGAAITALELLLGDRSLVVGRSDGTLEVWFPLLRGTDRALQKVRSFPPREGPIVAVAPTPRGKGFLALDAKGGLALLYSTSSRVLWTGTSPVEGASALAFAPKSDGALVAGSHAVASLAVKSPHPEVGLAALFGKIWYEGYSKPEYAWQSSSGTEDFEPKLSLTPLLFGTLKGTVYSLLLAVPLGVLSAMYASQFLAPSLKRIVKPTVEIMASLPSVVLGFLAGLWLAPLLERVLPSIVLMIFVLPVLTILSGWAWERVKRRLRVRMPDGAEILLFLVVLTLGAAGCLRIGTAMPGWSLSSLGVPYDQRNAVVVGIAMGFAVIPIIFAIAEDAFSNVPRSLVSGSLALGASRWQTVTRVVLPTASPGIFAAVMVGFGRAIGETMIVLMATGNTPILDWSPFNGFRTLSANIATEIPEAPVGGTLYRTLFLAALLLFMLTFAVNTAAELVRQRLRRKYSSL
jgi:phosphate transport system permease protein